MPKTTDRPNINPRESDSPNRDAPDTQQPAAAIAQGEVGSSVLADTLDQTSDQVSFARDLSDVGERPPAGVPGYRILRRLGEGKYGSVWLAREQNTGKQVAIKFYTHRRGVDWSLLSREVEKLAVLYTSRNIVGLVSVGWDHDPPYYVMEYLERGSLANLLDEGPLGPTAVVGIATRIADALVHAHGSGVLHCDLKPANVLLDENLEPRLCDFGQSRLADEQTHALGTLFYMAPEQADLKAIPDARWDVYALGAIMYHMLCGTPPFRTPTADANLSDAGQLEDRLSLYRRLVLTAPRLQAHRNVRGIDPAFVEIIDGCLARDPNRRFPNAQAVLDRLTARERARARRPLLLLGLALPLMLLASSAPLAAEAMRVAVTTARDQLTDRALESDVVSVNLLAQSIRRELEERLKELDRIANEPEVREAIARDAEKPRQDREQLVDLLSAAKRDVDDQHRTDARLKDASWFLTDKLGFQRWRSPESLLTMDQRFAHRDYFHGLDQEFAPALLPPNLKPIRAPHISLAYPSTSTGQLSIALSVPVWNSDETEVIGVLGRSLFLSNLLVQYEDVLRDQQADGVTRVISLVDNRDWRILAHPWIKESQKKNLKTDDRNKLVLNDKQAEQLKLLVDTIAGGRDAGEFDRTTSYQDPVAMVAPEQYGGAWLAAFRPVEGTGWVAVVQERLNAVHQPVEEMRARMLRYAFSAVIVAACMIAGTWWLIVRLASVRVDERGIPRGRSRREHGRNNRTASGLSVTSNPTHRPSPESVSQSGSPIAHHNPSQQNP